uniref:Uncharacterized protein n=1 Tax=Arundo donax TaxID=35708 RepID=A0A0A9HLV0_ARUDO
MKLYHTLFFRKSDSRLIL